MVMLNFALDAPRLLIIYHLMFTSILWKKAIKYLKGDYLPSVYGVQSNFLDRWLMPFEN